MSFYDDASLVFLPSGGAGKDTKAYSIKPTDGSGDFTFSRGNNLTATRVDSNGLIEKGRENLLFQSNQFDTTWVTSGTPSLSSGQSGYDGSTDAWLYTNNGSEYIYQDETTNVATYSIFAKKGNGGIGDFVLLFTDGVGGRYFDLDNGVLGSEVLTGLIDSKIELVSGTTDWYRCSITFASSTRVRIYASLADNDFASVASIYIQDAQLEIGLVATEYIESGATTGKAGILEDSPRFDYSGGASCPSLLLEPSRTNIVPISEGIPEDINAVTLTENYGTSPEGLQNSLKVQKNGVSSNDRILPIDNYNATLVSGTSYFVSAFVKNIDVDNGGLTTIGCRISGGSLFRLAYEWTGSSLAKNTTTGSSTGTRVNEICEDYGNGWWRIGFGFEADGTTSNIEIDVDRQNSSATTSIETYGWQLEQGSYPTSYIPNHSGGSVTRNADDCGGAGTSSTFNDSEGVLYVELSYLQDGRLAIKNSDSSDQIVIGSVGGNVFYRVKENNTNVITEFTGVSGTLNRKIALRYKSRDTSIFIDGVEYNVNTSNYTLSGLNEFLFVSEGGSNTTYGNVKQVLVFGTALSDSECITLTS